MVLIKRIIMEYDIGIKINHALAFVLDPMVEVLHEVRNGCGELN